MVDCDESPSDISLTLRKLTDQLLSKGTTVSRALDPLNSIITNESWDQPNAVELSEAARLLNFSVEQLESPTENQFQSVSRTFSLVYKVEVFSISLVETMKEFMSKVEIPGEETSFQHLRMVTNAGNFINNDIIGYGRMLQEDTISNGCQITAGVSIEELAKAI